MSDEQRERTPLERAKDILSQLKEMRHYSKSNIEKLTAFWMELDDELKRKEFAERVNDLLPHQNSFHEALHSLIEDLETACRKEEESAS